VLPPLVSFDAYKCTGTLSRKYALFINPVQVKGVDIAFDLAASRPDIPFLFVEGWTLEDDYFNDLSEKARRPGNVTLRRRTTNVKELYREARVLLAPSIPVLASSLGGLPESVGPGGILVDPTAGSEAWVAALSELWDDADTYEKYSVAAEQYAQRDQVQTGYIIGEFIRRADETIAKAGRQQSAP
jgi:glycosyltransferase involved in cell wall biosynthesis